RPEPRELCLGRPLVGARDRRCCAGRPFARVAPLDPAGRLAAEVAVDGDVHRVTLSNVGVYGIAVLSG
ncbi:MAG: hypothetical protein ACXVQT_10825, partial [Actinomycetota bacterium]